MGRHFTGEIIFHIFFQGYVLEIAQIGLRHRVSPAVGFSFTSSITYRTFDGYSLISEIIVFEYFAVWSFFKRFINFGDGFKNICRAIKSLSGSFHDFDFVYPVHYNPNVRKSVREILGDGENGNIFLIDPLDYLHFVYMMNKCYLLLTDSGGIQEEAPDLGKPVVVMREITERTEALAAGTIKLTGTDYDKIVSAVSRLILDKEAYNNMASRENPYGDGKAAERIVRFLSDI